MARHDIFVRFDMLGERALSSRFVALEEVPTDFSVPFTEMSLDFFQNNAETFAQQGPGWKPLMPSTIRDRLRKGFGEAPILVRTGRLMLSLTQPGADGQVLDISPMEMQIGTRVPYAMYHQTGSIKVFNHPPKRSPIDLRPSLQNRWNRRIVDWLRREFDYVGDR